MPGVMSMRWRVCAGAMGAIGFNNTLNAVNQEFEFTTCLKSGFIYKPYRYTSLESKERVVTLVAHRAKDSIISNHNFILNYNNPAFWLKYIKRDYFDVPNMTTERNFNISFPILKNFNFRTYFNFQ